MGEILLTGASGQIGREITARASREFSVHRPARAAFDITNREAVQRLVGTLKPSIVVNAAAFTSVDQAETDQAEAFGTNRDGPAHLAEACAAAGIPLVHISTDYVFDGTKQSAYTEDDTPAPINVYGASKLAGEDAVRDRWQKHVILRTCWLYGIGGNNFVRTILRLAHEQDTLRVVNDQIGCPTFAGDLADAVLTIAASLRSEASGNRLFGTFHCAGAGTTSWHGFATKIVELAAPATGRKPAIQPVTTADYPRPARRPANSALDCHKLAETYGISLRPWQDALREALDAMLAVAAPARAI